MHEPKKLMLAGDWHGNIGWAVKVVDYAAEQGCDTILQLGDFGYWTDTLQTAHYLRSLTGALTRTGITLYWLDGNHEDFSRRAEWAPPSNDTLNPITYLPRYPVGPGHHAHSLNAVVEAYVDTDALEVLCPNCHAKPGSFLSA
jgi:hypothetical protein